MIYIIKLASLHYVGCYKGSTAHYVAVKLPTTDTLTIEFCIQRCRLLNTTYSLLQGGVTCLCGDDYGQISPESDCQVPCAGNEQQYCGGKNSEDGKPTYVVYAVNHSLWCSSDADCKLNEACTVINLKYTNVSRCRCKQGLHRMSTWEYCSDIDECQSDTSVCNPGSEICINTIGSYRCECKDGFIKLSGKCEQYSSTPTTGILLGVFLAISLLINGLLIGLFFSIKRLKSKKPEARKGLAQTEFKLNSTNASDQREINYEDVPETAGQSSVYEQLNLEQRQTSIKPTSVYAELIKKTDLKQDNYMNAES